MNIWLLLYFRKSRSYEFEDEAKKKKLTTFLEEKNKKKSK